MPPMSLLVSFSDADSDLHSERPEAARSPILLLPGPSGPWCPCFRRLRGSCCCLHLSTCLAHLSCIPGRAWVSACQFNEQPVDAPFLCAWVDAISGRGAFCGCNTAINSLAGYSMIRASMTNLSRVAFSVADAMCRYGCARACMADDDNSGGLATAYARELLMGEGLLRVSPVQAKSRAKHPLFCSTACGFQCVKQLVVHGRCGNRTQAPILALIRHCKYVNV